jgi:hypothetical protein
VRGLGQLFCFPRKIVEFPIHFCLVYLSLSNFSKLFEFVLYRFIYSNVRYHISESQHGFVSLRSTITNLVCITDYITNALDNNTQVDVIYTDFSKAFDKLNHNILLSKLSAFGFSPSLLYLIKSYVYI